MHVSTRSVRNLIMYRLAHEQKKLRAYPNLDFNPLTTKFSNLTKFLPTNMHSESMQHIKREENKHGISIRVDRLCRDGADVQYMQYSVSKSRITSPQTCKKLI